MGPPQLLPMGSDIEQPLLDKSAPADPPEPKPNGFRVHGSEVEAWNEEHFSALRKFHGVDGAFHAEVDGSGCLRNELSTFDLGAPRVEGKFGKGGHHQYTSSCRNFICKSLADDDHKSLLRRTESYVERMLTGQSLLVPFYMHFREPKSNRCFVIMGNLAPAPSKGTWDRKYDLKGCADDKTLEKCGRMVEPVRKRWYRMDRWSTCCWSELRWDYWRGKESARGLKFYFPPDQRSDIVQKIRGDVNWLIQEGLMDYSLLLSVRYTTRQDACADSDGSSSAVRQYAMFKEGQDEVTIVSLGIIDFLQPWTCAKKVAQCIKVLEFNKATIPPEPYGKRFAKHFEDRFMADATLTEYSKDNNRKRAGSRNSARCHIV